MSLIEHFATDSVDRMERLNFWNRVCSETYSGLAVDTDEENFRANMRRWQLDELIMIRPVSGEAAIQRMMHSWRDDLDRMILHMQHRGRSRNVQYGIEADLHAGDMTLCSTGDYYRTDISDGNDMLVVEMPRSMLATRIPDLGAAVAHRIPGDRLGTRLLHDFLLSLWQQGYQSQAEPLWQKEVAGMVADLIALAVNHKDGVVVTAGQARLKDMLLKQVDAQLSDPELGTASLARDLDVSVRTVQNIFSSLGTTPSAYILDRRLQTAADRMISDPGNSITSIAYDVGFNESAYFSRCFRRKFKVTPSMFRSGNMRSVQ